MAEATPKTHALLERYSSATLAKLRKESVVYTLFNHRYEGTPTAGAVKIPVRDTEVEVIKDYDRKTGTGLTYSDTTLMTLPIDQELVVNELVDGYEAAAVPDRLVADRLDSAGYVLADTLDMDCASLLATKGTAYSNTTAMTKNTIYETIVDMKKQLKKAKVRANMLWLLVSPDVTALFEKSPEFIKASQLGDTVTTAGFAGRVSGMPVYETLNLPEGVEMIMGNSEFAHLVDEWKVPVSVNDLKDGKHVGASAIQGRRIYGRTISRPNTILVKKIATQQDDTPKS